MRWSARSSRSSSGLLALRQPVASDLRQIVAALKITGDIERIGDYAANVAKRSIVLAQFAMPLSLAGLAHMATMVQAQLKSIIDALGDSDADKAVEVWRSDQVVDDIYNAIFRELITYMMEDPRNITPCTHLLFIAKNLERIGDHATNIAENLYYAVKGESLAGGAPEGRHVRLCRGSSARVRGRHARRHIQSAQTAGPCRRG